MVCPHGKEEVEKFMLIANNHRPTIKFTNKINKNEIPFLCTTVYKGER